MTELFVDRYLPGVLVFSFARLNREKIKVLPMRCAGFARTNEVWASCPREVKVLHRTGRCARHFLAYETGCYADRSERCTAYAVPSAQVSCVQAFSSSFANLQLDFFFLRIKVYFNVDYFKMLLGFERTIYFGV